ncbi:MAG: hypothetical protein AB9846_17770 [Tenuifilaceae bacterium]
MSISKKEDTIAFSFKGIELLGFDLIQPTTNNLTLNTFNFDIRSEIRLNNELKLIMVVITINLFNQEKTINLGNISTSCIFEVLDYNKYVDMKSNTPNFPNDFMVSINSISLSTTRGIMFSQFRGTYLHNAILPIIDPKSFVAQK